MVYYFIGNNSNWSSAASWATYSGGTSLTSSNITGFDTVIFDANSGNCNFNPTSAYVATIDFTNYSKTFSFTAMPNYLVINNNLTLGASMGLRYVTSGGITYSFSTTNTTGGGFFILPGTQSSYSTASVKTNNKYLNGLITFGYRYYQALVYNFSVNLLDTLNCDSIGLYGSAINNNTVYWATGTLSFTGSYGFNTKNLLGLNAGSLIVGLYLAQSGNYILNSGVTYSVTDRLTINATIGNYSNVILKSSVANQSAYLNVKIGADVSVSQTDTFDIDSSNGKTIRIYNGTPTRCNNIVSFNYTDVQPFVSGFTL